MLVCQNKAGVAQAEGIRYLTASTTKEKAGMSGYKGTNFNDRAKAAAAAKQAALEKFRAKPAPDDPAVLARQAERQAIAEARAQRAAEREVARQAEAARLAAEAETRRVEQLARDAEEKRRQAEEAIEEKRRQAEAAVEAAQQAIRNAEMEVERKAARDARYAARKARR